MQRADIWRVVRGTPGKHFPGGHRRGVTPVPIPNTEVKLSTADGTAWETAWESRSLPGLFLKPAVERRRAFFVPAGSESSEVRVLRFAFLGFELRSSQLRP